jgi:hypothetical protein
MSRDLDWGYLPNRARFRRSSAGLSQGLQALMPYHSQRKKMLGLGDAFWTILC